MYKIIKENDADWTQEVLGEYETEEEMTISINDFE